MSNQRPETEELSGRVLDRLNSLARRQKLVVPEITRREVLRTIGLGAVALGLGACGGETTAESTTSSAPGTTSSTVAGGGASVPDGAGRQILVSGYPGSTELAFKEAVVPVFENLSGATVIFESGASAERLSKLQAQAASPTVDVFVNGAEQILIAREQDLVVDLDRSQIPNIVQLADWATNSGPASVKYGLLRFGLGMVGDLDPSVKSWEELLTREDLAGRVGMPIIAHSMFAKWLVVLAEIFGGSQDNIDPALAALREVEPSLLTVGYASWVEQAMAGECVVSPEFDYQIVEANREGFDLVYVDPAEGALAADNSISVVANTENADLAYFFLNLTLDEEVQTKFCEIWLGAPANTNANPQIEGSEVELANKVIDKIRFFDDAFIASKRAEWTERLNAEVLPSWS